MSRAQVSETSRVSQRVRFIFADAKEETLIDFGLKALRYHTGSAKLNFCMSHAWRICFVVEKNQSIRWSVKLQIIAEWEIFINGIVVAVNERWRSFDASFITCWSFPRGEKRQTNAFRRASDLLCIIKSFYARKSFKHFAGPVLKCKHCRFLRDYCLFEGWKWNIVDAHNLFLLKKWVFFVF